MSNKSEVDLYGFAIGLGCIIAALWYGWYEQGTHVVKFTTDFAETLIHGVNWVYNFMPRFAPTDWLIFNLTSENFITNKDLIIEKLRLLNSSHPSMETASLAFFVVGTFFRVPIVILGIVLSWLVFSRSKPSRLSNKFNVFTLAEYSKEFFPEIKVAIDAKLTKKGGSTGVHRQEESPVRFAILNNALKWVHPKGELYAIRFAKNYKLDTKKKTIFIQDTFDEDEGLPVIHKQCQLDVKPIRKLFVKQIEKLGIWGGDACLPPQHRALYAVFLLFIKGEEDDKDRGLELLNQFNRTYKSNRKFKKELMFDDTGVDEVIEQLGNTVAVKNTIKKHKYTINVLMAIYHKATYRKSKLPPNKFYWLKEVDRGAWYALHQNLSPSAWTESAGPRGLTLTENKIKRPTTFPFTDNAIEGFVDYISMEGWLNNKLESDDIYAPIEVDGMKEVVV